MGYAFINFTSYLQVPAFYEEFRGKKWDRFNSDKVAQASQALNTQPRPAHFWRPSAQSSALEVHPGGPAPEVPSLEGPQLLKAYSWPPNPGCPSPESPAFGA